MKFIKVTQPPITDERGETVAVFSKHYPVDANRNRLPANRFSRIETEEILIHDEGKIYSKEEIEANLINWFF